MIRRFNYTRRKRIPLDRISIHVTRTDHMLESFDAVIRLDDMGLPDLAKVYTEIYHRTDLARYDFGTVGNIVRPEDTGLSQLAHHEGLRFRVMVVDESGECGLILAIADKVRPSGIVEKRSILPVEFRDLGRQVWKVNYDGDEPVLLLNERIPNIHNLARTDPCFHLYVYPAVIRDIFTHMFLVDGLNDLDGPLMEWHSNWLKFAGRFLPDDAWTQLQLQDDSFASADVLRWIDKLVEEFCSSRTREWFKLISLEEVG
jgi:hypothetical protein